MSEENFDLDKWRNTTLERMRRGETNIQFQSKIGDEIRERWQRWRESANPDSKSGKYFSVDRNDFLTEAENLISESLETLRGIQENALSLPDGSHYYWIVLKHLMTSKNCLDAVVDNSK